MTLDRTLVEYTNMIRRHLDEMLDIPVRTSPGPAHTRAGADDIRGWGPEIRMESWSRWTLQRSSSTSSGKSSPVFKRSSTVAASARTPTTRPAWTTFSGHFAYAPSRTRTGRDPGPLTGAKIRGFARFTGSQGAAAGVDGERGVAGRRQGGHGAEPGVRVRRKCPRPAHNLLCA